MSLKRALPREKYLSLQRQLQRSGELYEDRDFPPNFRSLFTKTRPSVNLQWKRPKVCFYSRITELLIVCFSDINILYSYINVIISDFPNSFPFFFVCICAISLTCNLFSFNADVNWLPGSASPYGFSRQPVL